MDFASTSSMYVRPALDLQNPSSKVCTNLVFEQHTLATEGMRVSDQDENIFPPSKARTISITKGAQGSVRKQGKLLGWKWTRKIPLWRGALNPPGPILKDAGALWNHQTTAKKCQLSNAAIAHEHWSACSAFLISLGQASKYSWALWKPGPLMEM